MSNFLYNIIIYPLYEIIEVVYLVVYKLFKNPGFAVIGVSVAVTFLCLPLYVIAEKWQETERNKQKEMKPGIDRIKKAFKGDEQYMILTTFYRQNHYHPLMALRSSISLLIQIPFFMAAYSYLSNLEELRGFSFYFIKNMGAPDAMFHIGSFPINVLPIAMTLINIISGAIYTRGLRFKDKAPIYGMALLFLIILYNSPSGLVLYWTMNNVFSLIKNIFYKLKNPLKALYICLCAGVLCMDYYLIFKHNGFLHRRIMMMAVVSIILVSPLIIKLIKYLLKTIFKNLVENKKLRNTLFFVSILILWILMGYTLPSSVIASSPAEFSFIGSNSSPSFILFNSGTQIFGLFVFWFGCIYLLFGKEVKTVFAVLFSCIAYCALVNAFVFAGDYGLLSPILAFSDPATLKAAGKINLLNLIVLALPIILIFILVAFKKTKWITYASSFICFALTIVSLINFSKINRGYKEAKKLTEANAKDDNSVTPIFHLSKTEQNVLVIMLDRGISAFVPNILEEKPELKEKLSGFIYYPNTFSFGRNTLFGSSAMFGGYDYTPLKMNMRSDEPLVKKHNEALLVVPKLFKENGFEVTVTDSSWANYKWVPDLSIYNGTGINAFRTITTYTDIWLSSHKEIKEISSFEETLMKRNFAWYSILKVMPTVFRDTIYNDGFYWNTNQSVQDLQATLNNYAVLDYLPELTDFTSSSNTYTYIVNELTHEPQFLQAPDYTPVTKVTDFGSGPYANDVHYHANIAAFLRLSEFFDYLKENQVYDNTRIIIVSDHSVRVGNDRFKGDYPLRDPCAFNPLLFVKDFDAAGSFIESNELMTNADVPSLSLQNLIPGAVNPNTGTSYETNPKKDGLILTDCNTWSPDDQHTNTFNTKGNNWYFVKDNIVNPSNWKIITEDQALKREY